MARIVVIDDDEAIRAFVATVLKVKGHDVLALASGKEAVLAHTENPAELIITDILMPDFDGIEVIRRFKRSDNRVRILAISGGGWAQPEQFLTMAARLGADATLAKPFTVDQLLHSVERLLAS
jgi:DNA-binding response OmpR family regulator